MPEFTFQGIALCSDDLDYAPADEGNLGRKTENLAPPKPFKEGAAVLNNDKVGSQYTINENSDGKIDKWGYTRKEYNLAVTPKLNGKTGSSYTVSFTIGEGTGGSEPTASTTSPANR